MKWIRPKQEDAPRFPVENVLAFAEQIIKSTSNQNTRIDKLLDLRKVFLRQLQSQHIADCYSASFHQAPDSLELEDLLCKEMIGYDYESVISSAELVLDLAQDVILPTPWHPKRMLDNIGKFGSNRALSH